jgi:hypothetical protein
LLLSVINQFPASITRTMPFSDSVGDSYAQDRSLFLWRPEGRGWHFVETIRTNNLIRS